MSSKLPVLIVGAGPTGLMMACELAHLGIPFRIIDKNPEPTLASNATWIQTRTLEIFDQIGIVDRFLKLGHLCEAINLYEEGEHLVKIPLEGIDSIYPFILMLPQSQTEKILNDHLEEYKYQVERSVELIDINHQDGMSVATLKHPDGHTELVTSEWLIASDGANSLVREKCGLHFPGEDLTEQFMVADATIDFSFMPKDEMHLFFDKGTMLAAFPLGENKYRVAANLHLDYPRKLFTQREVIEIVQERAHGKYYVTNVSWISPFWIHGKVVEHMRHGSIFLVGDAAHIHSPAGGQGMNTGLQDAHNLAWKLALVIQGHAKKELLETYHQERYPIVKEVVKQSDDLTKMALFDTKFLSKLRTFCQRFSHDSAAASKKIGMWITQLDIRYQHSLAIDEQSKVNTKAPQPGARAPDVMINKATTLFHSFNNSQHNILFFAGSSTSQNLIPQINDVQQQLSKMDSTLVKLWIISPHSIGNLDNVILDEKAVIHERYQVKNVAVYIIRPDGYIAYGSDKLNVKSIEAFLTRYLK